MSLASLKTLFIDTLVVQALPVTLQLIAMSFVGACLIGLIGGIIRGLKVPVLSQILGIYAQIIRGVPDMLVLLFLYATVTFGDTYIIAVTGISLIQGAYIMEIIKGGIFAVDKGQWEAAKAMSLPMPITLLRIVIPAAGPDRPACYADQRHLRCVHHRLYGADQACGYRHVRLFECADRIRLRSDYLLYYVSCADRSRQATGKICSEKDNG